MSTNANSSRFARPTSYYYWVGVFLIAILLIAGGFYYATQKVAYIWRWNRIPIYFVYQDDIEIISDIEGEVEKVEKDGSKALVMVKGLGESQSYTVPAESVSVDVGE